MCEVKLLNSESNCLATLMGSAMEFQISFKTNYVRNVNLRQSKKLKWKSRNFSFWFETHASRPYTLKVALISMCKVNIFHVYCSTAIVDGNGTLCHPTVECHDYRKCQPTGIRTLPQELDNYIEELDAYNQELHYYKFNCYSIEYTDAKPFIRDEGITLRCTMMIVQEENMINAVDPRMVLPSSNFASDLLDDLHRIYESQQYADITLTVGDDKLLAHKLILCARSPVFAKMFEHEMLEKKESCIKITDIEFPILEEMISYLYSGKIKNMCFDTAYALYTSADKYAVSGLQYKCSNFLRSSLTVDKVCSVLCLADLHNDNELNLTANKFVFDNFEDVITTTGWLTMMKSNSELANDVLKYWAQCWK